MPNLSILRAIGLYFMLMLASFSAWAQQADPYKQDKYWYMDTWVMLIAAGFFLLILIFLLRKKGEKPNIDK